MFQHSQLFVLSFAAFLLMLGDGMVLALLPKTVISLTNSSLFVGYLASTYALSQVMSQLPIGMLADRWGAKLFLLMGYIVSFTAGLLFYFTHNVYLIFLGRVLQGMGEAPILSLAPAILSLQYSADKGKTIGLYNASIYLGLTLGPFFRVVLFPQWSDNQIFLLYAALCSVGVILIGCSMKTKPENSSPITEPWHIKSFLTLMKNPRILAVLWGITLYGAGFGIFMTVIPAFMLMVKGYHQSFINLFFSLFYIAISVAQIAVGWLSDRLGRQVFMVLGMFIAAAGFVVVPYFDHSALTSILGVSSFGLGTYYIASMAFLNEKVPANCKGAISGIYYLFWGVGMFWGPLILTGQIQGNNYQGGFFAFSLMLILQAILLFIAKLYPSHATRQIPSR